MIKQLVTGLLLFVSFHCHSQDQLIELCDYNNTYNYNVLGSFDSFYEWKVFYENKLIATSTEKNLQVTFTKAGNYRIEVFASNTICESQTQEYFILTQECRMPLISIPTAFTPNNDFLNDVFKVYASNIEKINIWMYNRWGNEVFYTEDPSVGWSGSAYNGEDAPQGIYVCLVQYTDVFGFSSQITKFVTLYR